jgi:hypothetical protein
MVAVDPIVAYLGARLDMHRANQMRSILAPLSQLASDYSCAVVAVNSSPRPQKKVMSPDEALSRTAFPASALALV